MWLSPDPPQSSPYVDTVRIEFARVPTTTSDGFRGVGLSAPKPL
jgi:hypothetical protein